MELQQGRRPRRMGWGTMVLLAIGLIGGAWIAMWFLDRGPRTDVLTLAQLSEAAELLTLRVRVQEVIRCEIRGHTGGVRVAVAVVGEAAVGVDLSAARVEQVDEQARTAVLILPQPRALQARVDQDRTQVIGLHRRGLWYIVPGHDPEVAIIEQALSEAQRHVQAAGESPEAQTQARQHAQAVLTTFCRKLGWQVQVRWE